MSATEHWNEERMRLQLMVAVAMKLLVNHMGTEDFYLPYDGALLQIRKVAIEDVR